MMTPKTSTLVVFLPFLTLLACDHTPVVLEWSNIQPTPGCFYLSGPRNLGSEYKLGERGTVEIHGATATLVAGDATLSGPIRGNNFELSRRVQCEPFPGWIFQFKETITGKAGLTHAQATYTYEECELQPDGSCVPGYCALAADVSARRARRNEPTYTPPANHCSELCAFRDGIAAETACGNDDCVVNCEAAFTGTCDREVVALGECEMEQDASAFECFGFPSLSPGYCDVAYDTYFACAVAAPPSGTCVEL